MPGFPSAGKRFLHPESRRFRWKLPDGSILEWDKQHGEVEKYDKTGRNHQGAYDPNTGEMIKDPIPDRTTPKFVLPPISSAKPTSALGDVLGLLKLSWQLSTADPLTFAKSNSNLGKSIVEATGITGAAATAIEAIGSLLPAIAF